MKVTIDIDASDLPEEMWANFQKYTWEQIRVSGVDKNGIIDIYSNFDDSPDYGHQLNVRAAFVNACEGMWISSLEQVEESIDWCDGLLSVLSDCRVDVSEKREELLIKKNILTAK